VLKFDVKYAYDFDLGSYSCIFKEHPDIEAIIHAATNYGRGNRESTSPFWVNEVLPIKIMELAVSHNVKLFINIDTFFNSISNIKYDYLQSYTLSKKHFQEWGKLCYAKTNLSFINLKLFHMYGIGDTQEKFIPSIIKKCLLIEEINLTRGDQLRDFIYIDDVVSAIRRVLGAELESGYHSFDLGSGQQYSIRYVVELIKELSQSTSILNFGSIPTRDGELVHDPADITQMQQLGWYPRTCLNEGMSRVITNMRLQFNDLASV